MAIRIPRDFQLRGSEVEIIKRNGEIIIREIPQNIRRAFELLQTLPEDFFAEGRTDPPPQNRDSL